MNTSLLVVPALAGYWVLSRTYITHFVVNRHVGYRFIFETALAGLGILAAAHLLVRVAAQLLPYVAGLEDGKWAWAPFEHAATLATLAVIALAIPPLVNWRIPEDADAARRAPVEESRFGWLLRESLEKGLLVEISTTTRKSYIGFVLGEDPQGWEQDVALMPVLSGYRDPESLRLRITANYSRLPAELLQNYAVTIATKEIVSISRFDPQVYRAHVSAPKEPGRAD